MDYQEKYRQWVNEVEDPELKRELAELTDDREIEDRFYRSMEFGTGGMRGIIGAGTNRINIYTVRKATQGFAEYILQNGAEAATRGVAIAYDNRRKSAELALNTAGVLAANGIRAYLFESLRPIPELSFAVRKLHCFGGVVITASHNPPQYNGYKLYDETGCQLVPRYTDRVIRLVNSVKYELQVKCLSREAAGELIQSIGSEVDEAYYQVVEGIGFEKSARMSEMKIVFSPQHGTANIPVRRVLGDLGYQVIPVEEQCFPDTEFSNTENPNPETEASFALPLKRAKEEKAELVIITDPDCDRLGVAVRYQGEMRRLTGNQLGAVMLYYILSRRKEQGLLPENGFMFNTIVTSDLGDVIAESFGVRTEKTLTGFKFIGDKIHTHEEAGDGVFLFGYEESYGCLIGDFVRDKDAVQAAVITAEMADYYKRQGKTLYDVLEEIYARYGYYKDFLTSVEFPGRDGMKQIRQIMQRLRESEFSEAGVIAVEDYLSAEKQAEGFLKSDVLRFLLADGGWAAVRPSGTEPKCKYYYSVRGNSREEAEERLMQLRNIFEQ